MNGYGVFGCVVGYRMIGPVAPVQLRIVLTGDFDARWQRGNMRGWVYTIERQNIWIFVIIQMSKILIRCNGWMIKNDVFPRVDCGGGGGLCWWGGVEAHVMGPNEAGDHRHYSDAVLSEVDPMPWVVGRVQGEGKGYRGRGKNRWANFFMKINLAGDGICKKDKKIGGNEKKKLWIQPFDEGTKHRRRGGAVRHSKKTVKNYFVRFLIQYVSLSFLRIFISLEILRGVSAPWNDQIITTMRLVFIWAFGAKKNTQGLIISGNHPSAAFCFLAT